MPQFTTIERTAMPDVWTNPAQKPKYDHQFFVPMVLSAAKGKVFEVTPDLGETVRAVRVRIARTATEQGVKLEIGQPTDENGTPERCLIVFGAEPKVKRPRRA